MVKFTVGGYAVFLFCIWFLIIELVIWLVQKIQYHNYSKDIEEQSKQREAEEWKRNLEMLWTEVDQFSPNDYKLLLKFIKTEMNHIIALIHIWDFFVKFRMGS